MSRAKIERGLSKSFRTTGKLNVHSLIKRAPDKGGFLPVKGQIPVFADGKVNIPRPFQIPLPKLMPEKKLREIPGNVNKGNQKRLMTKARKFAALSADARKPIIKPNAGMNGIDIAKSRKVVPNSPAGHRTPVITHMGVPAKGASYRQDVSPKKIDPKLFRPTFNYPLYPMPVFVPAKPDATKVIKTPSPSQIKKVDTAVPEVDNKPDAPAGNFTFVIIAIAALFFFRG